LTEPLNRYWCIKGYGLISHKQYREKGQGNSHVVSSEVTKSRIDSCSILLDSSMDAISSCFSQSFFTNVIGKASKRSTSSFSKSLLILSSSICWLSLCADSLLHSYFYAFQTKTISLSFKCGDWRICPCWRRIFRFYLQFAVYTYNGFSFLDNFRYYSRNCSSGGYFPTDNCSGVDWLGL